MCPPEMQQNRFTSITSESSRTFTSITSVSTRTFTSIPSISTRVILIGKYIFKSKPTMSLIGQVFNRAVSKNISVYISESGDGYMRLTGAISQRLKNRALAVVKDRFENGTVFKEEDMRQMARLTITWGIDFGFSTPSLLTTTSNMPHESAGHTVPHYSLRGEAEDGTTIKGGHVTEDPSLQTVRFLQHLSWERTHS